MPKLKTTFVILINGHINCYDRGTGLVKRYDDYPSEEEITKELEPHPGAYAQVEKQYFLTEH